MKQSTASFAAAAAVGALVLWLWLAPAAPDATPPLTVQAERTARSSAVQQPLAPAAPAAVPTDGNAAAVAASTASGAAPQDTWQALKAWLGLSDSEPVVLDLCGIGRMPISKPPARQGEGGDLLPPHLGTEAQAQALQSLLARLDSGPPRWRAAAALMRSVDGTTPTPSAMLGLAQQSTDPADVVLALQACKLDEACRSEIAQRWLQLEPENLAAMLEAQPPHLQADATLLPRLAQARSYRLHSSALMQVVLEATANDPPSHLQPGLWIRAKGVEGAFGVAPFKALVRACPESMAADHPNKFLCTAVARTLVEHSDTTLGLIVGLRLAERTFMTKPEAAQQRAVLNDLMFASAKLWQDPMPTSCASVESIRSTFLQHARLGELAALRAKTN